MVSFICRAFLRRAPLSSSRQELSAIARSRPTLPDCMKDQQNNPSVNHIPVAWNCQYSSEWPFFCTANHSDSIPARGGIRVLFVQRQTRRAQGAIQFKEDEAMKAGYK